MRPTSARVLKKLFEAVDQTVTKEDLLAAGWPELTVTDNSLQQCIHEIRVGLGDDGARIVRTVPRRGYRLIPPVERVQLPPPRGDRRVALSLSAVFVIVLILGVLAVSKVILSAGSATPQDRSVSVLPFDNLGGDQRWSLIAEGLTQDTVADLAKSDFIRVSAGVPDASEPRRDFELQGSLQYDGNIVRVRSWLTRTENEEIVWSHRWSGPAENIFALQDAVVDGVSAALTSPWSGAIAADDLRLARARDTDNFEAYELYLLGAYHKHRFTPDDYRIAEGYLRRATALDPSYAKAFSTLAVVYALMGSTLSDPEALSQVQEKRVVAIEQAARLAPDDPQTLVQMNWLYGYRGDFEAADNVLRRAVDLAPNNADVLAEAGWIGNWRSVVGPDSVAWVERAKELNTTWPDWYAVGAGLSRFNMGDYAAAVEALTEAPDFIERYLYTASAQALLGDMEAAQRASDRLLEIAPHFRLETYLMARVIVQDEVRGPLVEGARLAGVPF
nr:winged helix-turn-helix domain-containing protein [Celeribacter litoreus]